VEIYLRRGGEMPDIEHLLNRLTSLSLEDAIKLDQALHGYIEILQLWRLPGGDLATQAEGTAVGCDRLEYVKCGKKGCRCAEGEGHGPYWYRYSYSGNGKQKKKYLGREKPL
jgi:hypothetical protein